MRTRRAWVALLLAFFVALSPLAFGPFVPCAKGAEVIPAPTLPNARHTARALADTRAVPPQPQSLPAPQQTCQEMPTGAADGSPFARHAAHRLCTHGGTGARFIPAQAVQCYMDHPHHAPPRFA